MEIRQLYEMANRWGRNRQSAQTGYLHYHYNASSDEKHDTIPTIENGLFALSLFHVRTSESVTEAKIYLIICCTSKTLF